jgi:hypothetical protein
MLTKGLYNRLHCYIWCYYIIIYSFYFSLSSALACTCFFPSIYHINPLNFCAHVLSKVRLNSFPNCNRKIPAHINSRSKTFRKQNNILANYFVKKNYFHFNLHFLPDTVSAWAYWIHFQFYFVFTLPGRKIFPMEANPCSTKVPFDVLLYHDAHLP